MGYRPIRFSRITNHFASPGSYASRANVHGPAGHHTGVDFAGPIPGVSIADVAVRSSTPGWVMESDHDSVLGNYVHVYFAADDVLLSYWHLNERLAEEGDRVLRGELIGRVGSTGNSSAPHLHVQANRGKDFDYHGHIDPSPWVRGRAWAGTRYLWRKRHAAR